LLFSAAEETIPATPEEATPDAAALVFGDSRMSAPSFLEDMAKLCVSGCPEEEAAWPMLKAALT